MNKKDICTIINEKDILSFYKKIDEACSLRWKCCEDKGIRRHLPRILGSFLILCIEHLDGEPCFACTEERSLYGLKEISNEKFVEYCSSLEVEDE